MQQTITSVVNIILSRHRQKQPHENTIIAVTGKVACGKTRISTLLQREITRRDVDLTVCHIPFDYWVNRDSLDVPTYHERFLLADYALAVRNMAVGKSWLCPRSDPYPCNLCREQENILRCTHVPRFKESILTHYDSGRRYETRPSIEGSIIILEGTLNCLDQNITSLYEHTLFIDSPWVNRVARLLKRFRHGEIFGGSGGWSEDDYVGFIVDEAVLYADAEIDAQKKPNMTLITNVDLDLEHSMLTALHEWVKISWYRQQRYRINLDDLSAVIQ